MSDERDDKRLLIPAGMFFVVIGGWLLSWWTYCNVVLGFVNQWSVPAILLFTKNADYENEKCLKIKVFICILHSKQKKDTILFNFDSPL